MILKKTHSADFLEAAFLNNLFDNAPIRGYVAGLIKTELDEFTGALDRCRGLKHLEIIKSKLLCTVSRDLEGSFRASCHWIFDKDSVVEYQPTLTLTHKRM